MGWLGTSGREKRRKRMLVNPYEARLATYDGTRLLKETYGIVGRRVREDSDPRRLWVIQGLYAPIPRRALGGVRARLLDDNGFSTFVNQRDLEVLLGIGRSGSDCQWLKSPYPHPGDRDWCGLCMDRDDLMDDLLDLELFLRCSYPQNSILPPGIQIERRLHLEEGKDVRESLVLVWDMDARTGESPDTKITTVDDRWASVHQERLHGTPR